VGWGGGGGGGGGGGRLRGLTSKVTTSIDYYYCLGLTHLRYWNSISVGAYTLNTRSKEWNTVFYSYLACFMDTVILDVYVNIGLTRKNTFSVFLWLRPRNT